MDLDASTEDESDVGEPKKYGDLNPDDFVHPLRDYQRSTQFFLRDASMMAASRSKLIQEASKFNNHLENIMVVYQNLDPMKKKMAINQRRI